MQQNALADDEHSPKRHRREQMKTVNQYSDINLKTLNEATTPINKYHQVGM